MNINFLLSNIISSMLMKVLQMEPMYAMTLSSLIGGSLPELDKNMIKHMFTFEILIPLFTICCIIGSVFFYYKRNNDLREYYHVSFYNPYNMKIIMKYIEMNPDFFEKQNLEIGNDQKKSTFTIYFPEIGNKTMMNDTRFNMNGFLYFGMDMEDTKEEKKRYPYIRIYGEKNGIFPKDYYEHIEKYVEDKLNNSYLEFVYFAKITPNDKSTSTSTYTNIYEGSKADRKDRYNKFMLSYFNPMRDVIWNKVYRVHYKPEEFTDIGQIASCNFLFYGPPGTGKSTLSYRLAISLGRHLISLNILDFIEDKNGLYKMLMKPVIGHVEYNPSKCIFLLDEFDNTVRFLKNKETSYIIKNKNDVTKENSVEIPLNPKHSDIRLCDLLELFQGAVPIKGMILIATTNHYDYIKNTLESLVRPGRLTPIYISYLDWKSLQELSTYYFGNKLTIPKMKITCPTSSIIELAIECRNKKNPFNCFQNELLKLVSISQ